MSTCEQMQLVMSLALDRAAGDEEQQALASHLSACPNCAAAWNAMQAAEALLSTGSMALPPAGFTQRVMVSLQRREAARRRWRREMTASLSLGGLLIGLGLAGALVMGQLLAGWSPLSRALWIMIGESFSTLSVILDGLAVPLRIVGPWPMLLLCAGVAAIFTGSTSLGAWVVLNAERRGRQPARS
jgi:predicted anti-sigma-YlaC factor YlaD